MRPACLVALVLAAPVAVRAQAADTLSRDSSLVRALEQARGEGWYVRVGLADGSRVSGRIRAHADSLVYLVGARSRIDAIVSMERRQRRGGAALPFAVAGGLATGVLGYVAAEGLCERNCRWTSGLYAGAFSAAAGAGLGAFLGAVLFPGTTRWVRLWPPGH